MSRFRFFREHKYIIFELTQMARLLAITNFNHLPELRDLEPKLANLVALLKNHGTFEDDRILKLLKDKNIDISKHEIDHKSQQQLFDELATRFTALKMANDAIVAGEGFYVFYRTFMAKMILHMDTEERELWPLLKKNCTDEELRQVQYDTYLKMSAEQLLAMLKILFPHFNRDDKVNFCEDIQQVVPDKWQQIMPEVQKIV